MDDTSILSAIIVNQSLLKSQLSNTGKEVFYIDDFNETPIISGLYIDKKGETRFWTGSDWENTSCEVTDEILSMTDVLVDGPFVEELKDISLRFRGSSNQRIIYMRNPQR